MRRTKNLLLLVGIVWALGNLTWATAQQSIRIFGTTSTGTSRAILVNSSGAMTVTAASGSGYFPFVLTTSTTQLGTGANTTETDLWTYSLPAGHLSINGHAVRVTTWGTFGANANTKNVRIYFGATVLGLFTTTANGLAWRASGMVLRSGASSQFGYADQAVDLGGSNTQVRLTTPAETMANAITIKITGQNGSAVANDIIFRAAIVESLK
jgi:hypothetical protein